MSSRLLPWLKSPPPPADVVLAGLPRPRWSRLRLERFPVGIDKLRIDVALGLTLRKGIEIFVSALVRENVQQLWNQPVSKSSDAVLDGFRQVLREHQRSVVKDARTFNRTERIQLFQLAVLKQFIQLLDKEMGALHHELDEARQRAGPADGRSLQVHERRVVLGRHARHVRYRVANQLIREFMRLEHGGMRNLRQSVLGLSWPVPEAMLTNPVLQLDGIGGTRDFVRHYPMLLHDLEDTRQVGACLLETLTDWLPADVAQPAARGSDERAAEAARRHDRGAAHGLLDTGRWARCLVDQQELDEGAYTWLDEPENALALLGGSEASWPQAGPWRTADLSGLQRDLNQSFGGRLHRTGLLRKVNASYELAAIYPALGLVDAENLVFDFLSGDLSRRELLRRLAGLNNATEPAVLARRIDALRKEYRDSAVAGKLQVNARLAGDFLALRRDLKLGFRAFVAMDRIRLLEEERELSLARTNNVLQAFSLEDLAEDPRGNLAGHVIVKVDIRGGNEVIAGMRRRGLNAASHFSRYFYDPVERLRERFDAHKVVVEGDALILAVLDYTGDGAERFAVSRACCLAVGLIDLIDVMNAENDRLGLARLELGLGIAYADEPPTYLYDQSRRVIVSPAISQARRMSSCHLLLRENCTLPSGRGLCVAKPVHGEPSEDEHNGGLVRYNVNGIELDAAAFAQLHVEISLRKVRSRLKGGKKPAVMYVGSCPDVRGQVHWLVIREQTVKLWMGRQLLETEEERRSYFEVISDGRLIERVREQMENRRGAKKAQTPSGVRH